MYTPLIMRMSVKRQTVSRRTFPQRYTPKFGVPKARVLHLLAVPRHTETDERRYHLRMYVLNTALHSESVSNQMIPAIGHVSQDMSPMQFQSGLLAHSTKQLAVPCPAY